VLVLFKGEKTAVFWIGLVILGYSIYNFCLAGWNLVFYNIIYPAVIGGSASDIDFLLQSFLASIPELIGGIIFLIIGLYIMKVGIKKDQPLQQN
jgi:putative Mn2+ efflux pump MntP